MNNRNRIFNKSDSIRDCSPHMLFGEQPVHFHTIYSALGILTIFLCLLFSTIGTSYYKNHHKNQPGSAVLAPKVMKKPAAVPAGHEATDELISKLKEYGLWKIQPDRTVPRFFISSYPPDLNNIEDISVRKRVFLHALLPHALLVRQETLRRRERLQSIIGKIDCSPANIDFAADLETGSQCSWTGFLADDEISFIKNLTRRYRITSAQGLLERVDAVPTSIILAQGALESSWGSSRFAREGNSVFGMWTWKTKGMIPSRRDEGKTHKVRSYENVLDSVRAYQLTLNRLDSYEEFRQLRQLTDDPLLMAEGLTLYSERGDEYIADIKKVILSNNLQRYDSFTLADSDMQELSGPVSRKTLTGSGPKASL